MGKALTQQRGAEVGDAARWPRVRLGDVCEFIGGGTPDKSHSEYYGDEIPWVTVRDMTSSVITKTERCITRLGLERSAANLIPAGNVIISTHVGLGKVCLLAVDAAINQDLKAVIPISDCLSIEFLKTCFMVLADYIVSQGTGSTVKGVKLSFVQDLLIPLPPLSVQHEIVARLERELGAVDKLAKKFEELESAAEAEFKAELKETFEGGKLKVESGELGARRVKLGEVCDVLAGYAFKGDGFSDTGVPICGGLIISPEGILWDECKYWPTSVGLEEYLLKEDDVVVALDRPWISNGFKVGLIRKADCPSLLIQRTARLRSGNKIDYRYLVLMLRDDRFREHCTTSGTTVPHISHKDIESYDIPLPSLPVQREVVARLDAAKAKKGKLVAAARRGRETAALMRKAILKEAFE